jgi:hypothetical protein
MGHTGKKEWLKYEQASVYLVSTPILGNLSNLGALLVLLLLGLTGTM